MHTQLERESVVFLSFLIIMGIITIMPPYIICQLPEGISVFGGMKWAGWLSQGLRLHWLVQEVGLGFPGSSGRPPETRAEGGRKQAGCQAPASKNPLTHERHESDSRELDAFCRYRLISVSPSRRWLCLCPSTGYPCLGYLLSVLDLNVPFLLPGQDFPFPLGSPTPFLGFILHTIKIMKKLNSGRDSQVLTSTLRSYFVSPC